MNRHPFLFWSLIFTLTIQFNTAAANDDGITVDGFWKYAPLTDRWMSGGNFLRPYPEYLKDSSFPPDEGISHVGVPFADGISAVRILGGWKFEVGSKAGENADIDFARTNVFEANNDSGDCPIPVDDFFMCPKRLTNRIDPYVNAGIRDITVVLDNIPEPLVVDPADASKQPSYDPNYGQNAPPRNEKVSWHIGYQTARVLKETYPNVVFRYRVGTENGDASRFNGTEKQYFLHYSRIADAIHNHVSRDIEIMPFNQAGYSHSDLHKNVSMERLIPTLSGRTYSAQPVSLYLQKTKRHFRIRLKDRVEQLLKYWTTLEKHQVESGRTVVPTREVHEFGILLDEENEMISELQSAAFHAEGIMRFAQAGADRLFHWHNAYTKNGLLSATGWVYSVLDSMKGSVWTFPEVRVARAHKLSDYFSALSRQSDRSILMVSALNPDELLNEWKTPTINIPLKDIPRDTFKEGKLVNICMTSVQDEIRNQSEVIGSLTLKKYEHTAFVSGDNLIIRPLLKTNGVAAIVFGKKGCQAAR